jgi:toxin ParE1/3/4
VRRVSLSKVAAADLEAIDDYTIEHFGLNQAVRTSERFRETFEQLGEMPRSGQLRPELSPRGREFRYRTVLGSFVVVYERADDGIRVARVLHGARNLVVELERDAGDD